MMMLLLAAALSALTPEGHRLTLESAKPAPTEGQAWAAKHAPSWIRVEGMKRMLERPGAWFNVAWACGDSAAWWPAGRRLALVSQDGDTIPSTDILALSPDHQQRLTELGVAARWLNPADFVRLNHRGAKALKLWVRFARWPEQPTALIVTSQSEGR